MLRYITCIYFFVVLHIASAQTIKIDTIKIPPSQRFNQIQSNKMNFPLIKTGNPKIDSLINHGIKNTYTINEDINSSIDSAIIKWADDQIVFLDFVVTYCQNNIISLNISAEGCGAYCSDWTEYFNYSTLTGTPLNLNDMVDTTSGFRKLVYAQAKAQYDKKDAELKALLHDKTAPLDSATYTWALQEYTACRQTVNLQTFALYPTYLQLIEDCPLPNAIKALSPVIELKYNYADIKKYLKIKL